MFVPIACNAKGIQIHHVRNNHWITSSSTAGCVDVFDSVYNNLSTEVQLAKDASSPFGLLCKKKDCPLPTSGSNNRNNRNNKTN